MNTEANEEDKLQITELSRHQRRVLGVLIEKAYTTPEYYPLTIKAATTGSSQKSNRSPVHAYDEDEVLDVLEELRGIGLVGEVHTDGGRAARYRHYMRHKLSFTEPQLAIITELLLRGKQQLGELRTRAARMVPIASQAELKAELKSLLEGGFIQADGPIDRRGIQVDHNWYTEREGRSLEHVASNDDTPTPSTQSPPAATPTPAIQVASSTPAPSANSDEVTQLKDDNAQLAGDIKALQDEVESLRREFQQLSGAFEDLRHALGG
ncbi:UNVERIFIED_CONTAM: hypothetical protein GTU68_033516 [Idotea baltica]|nr:hypothetical protein [Idotea baltica]